MSNFDGLDGRAHQKFGCSVPELSRAQLVEIYADAGIMPRPPADELAARRRRRQNPAETETP